MMRKRPSDVFRKVSMETSASLLHVLLVTQCLQMPTSAAAASQTSQAVTNSQQSSSLVTVSVRLNPTAVSSPSHLSALAKPPSRQLASLQAPTTLTTGAGSLGQLASIASTPRGAGHQVPTSGGQLRTSPAVAVVNQRSGSADSFRTAETAELAATTTKPRLDASTVITGLGRRPPHRSLCPLGLRSALGAILSSSGLIYAHPEVNGSSARRKTSELPAPAEAVMSRMVSPEKPVDISQHVSALPLPFNPLKSSAETSAMHVGTVSDNTSDLKFFETGNLRRIRRETGLESVSTEKPTSRTEIEPNSTLTSEYEASTSQTHLRRTDDLEPVDSVPAVLSYRSRGRLAALLDPLRSGRALAPNWAVPSSKWRHLASTDDNTTTISPPITEPPSTSKYVDLTSDVIAPNTTYVNGTYNINANSTDVYTTSAGDVWSDTWRMNTSDTVLPSAEWSCNRTLIEPDLRSALRHRLSPTDVSICIYTLSFLLVLLATLALVGFIQTWRSSGRPSSSTLVLGLQVLAAVSKALYFVSAEYQPIAVATPSGRLAINECCFVFLLSAFIAHQYPRDTEGKATRQPAVQVICYLCVSLVVACSGSLSVLLLIWTDLCVVRHVVGVYALRGALACCGLLLSAANCMSARPSVSRSFVSQVQLILLFLLYSGLTLATLATLWSTDLATYLLQTRDVCLAAKATAAILQLWIIVAFCVHHSPMFSGLPTSRKCFEDQKQIRALKSPASSGNTLTGQNVSTHSQRSDQSFAQLILNCPPKKTEKTVEAKSGGLPTSQDINLVWKETDGPVRVERMPPRTARRSRSMLYNDHGFIRFRLEEDTDGESDARTLDGDNDAGPGQWRSVPGSERASADNLWRHGPVQDNGTPRWSGEGSPCFSVYRTPSMHLQDSIERALDWCDIWRVGSERGQLTRDQLHNIVHL